MHLRSLACWTLLVLLHVPEASAQERLDVATCRGNARLQHPEVAASRALAAAAKARQAIAFSGFLPILAGEGSFVATGGSGGSSTGFGQRGGAGFPTGTVSEAGRFFGAARTEIWSGSLSLRQTIWDFGRSTNRYQAAVAASRQALAQQQLAEELVDLAAEAAFRTAFSAGELVAAMEETRRQAEAHLELARGRSEVGLAARYDLSRAEVEVANAEVLLIQALNARSIALAQLAVACGMESLPPEVHLEPPPPRRVASLPPLEEAFEQALRRLPEIREANARLEVARQILDLAWSEFFPSVGATGTVGLRGTALDRLDPGWTGIVSLTVPLITGGADLAGVREAQAQVAAAEADLENLKRALRLDLQTVLLSVQEAEARLNASEKKEKAAAEGMRLAEGRYQTGLGSALELADAQSNLAAAKAQRVQSALDLSVAAANLERLLGERSDNG